MAFHIRRKLRNAVVDALKNLPTTAENVWPGRTWPIPPSCKAALLVYLEGGPSRFDAANGSEASLGLMRDERLAIQAVVRTNGSEPEDVLHAIAAEVEPAMMNHAGLGALVLARELINTELQARAEGDDRLGEMKLTYSLVVRTSASDPTANI